MSAPASTPLVVLAEDVAPIRRALREVLRLEGYAVREASDGDEALALLHGLEQPCVLLLDMMMARVHGADVVRALQRAAPHILARTRLVALTARPELAQGLPFEAVVRKPFVVAELLAVVHTLAPVSN